MKRLLRILILDCSLDERRAIQQKLDEGKLSFVCTFADGLYDFFCQYEQFQPNVVLANYLPAQTTAHDTLKLVRQREPHLPFLMLADAVGEEHFLDLMRRGATDCVLKHHLGRLVPAIDEALVAYDEYRVRERADHEFKTALDRYRDVVEGASDFIYSVDSKGGFQHMNPAGLKWVGHSLGELWKMTYFDLVLPEFRPRVSAHHIDQCVRRSPDAYLEFPIRTAAGEVRWVGQSSTPVQKHGIVVGFHIIARDITGSRQLTERYSAMVDHAPDIIYMADVQGNYTFLNKTGYSLLEVAPKDVVGKSWTKWIHPDDVQPTMARYTEMISRGENDFLLANRYVSISGKTLHLEHHIRIIRSESHGAAGFQGIARALPQRGSPEQDNIPITRGFSPLK